MIIAGFVGGGVARGLCVGILVTAISLFSCLSRCIPGICRANADSDRDSVLAGRTAERRVCENFDDISLIPTFVLTPLTYLGGVFYSLTLLPPFWQGLSHLNPIVYMISGFRYGFLVSMMYRW